MNFSDKRKKLKLKNDRKENLNQISVSETFRYKGRSTSKIAERVGVSDRTLRENKDNQRSKY